jgi:4-aminobutyrate aminotransferase-like enzyme
MNFSAALKARQEIAIAPGIGTRGIFAALAEYAFVWDVEGTRYIELAAGIAVNNTGHRHPRVMDAVREQAERFTHTCFYVTEYEPYVELAERL